MKKYRNVIVCMFILLFFVGGVDAQQKEVRILAIGNSFSTDAVEQYLHELALADGIPTIIGNMFIGGCSLERHVKNARDNAAVYKYRKIGVDGKKVVKNKVTLEMALVDEEWDYISLQQASPFSGIYETYVASLPELVAYVKAHVSSKTKLMLHQTWAYAANTSNTNFKNYNCDQLTMYHAIVGAVKAAGKLCKIKMIIPSGTAIQNARTSFVGDHMNRDGYHLDLKIGRYTAACTWFERIFRRNVIGNSFGPKGLEPAKKMVAQKAAHYAVKRPYRITDLSDIKMIAD